jgi:hypothetical protein
MQAAEGADKSLAVGHLRIQPEVVAGGDDETRFERARDRTDPIVSASALTPMKS